MSIARLSVEIEAASNYFSSPYIGAAGKVRGPAAEAASTERGLTIAAGQDAVPHAADRCD